MKNIKFICLVFLLLNMNLFSENIVSDFIIDSSPTIIDNKIFIQGINQDNGIISYITRFESSSHGDYRYSYVIYDYKNNQTLKIVKKCGLQGIMVSLQ